MSDWEVRVISETQQLRDRIKWLENGLKEIIKISKNMNISSDESRIVHIVQSTLDGEPTTADEYNESQEIEGIELKQELKSQYSDIDIAKSMIDEIDKQLEEEE